MFARIRVFVLYAGWVSVAASAVADPKPLNNLVTELARESSAPASGTIPFTLARDAWVHVAVAADVAEGGFVEAVLGEGEGAPVVARLAAVGPRPAEGMRFLTAGEHGVHLRSQGTVTVNSVVVRAVPELQYSKFPSNPPLAEEGAYDWAFLQAYVLPNINTVIGEVDDKTSARIDEWTRRGGKWIAGTGVPKGDGKTLSADEAYAFWSENPSVKDPRVSGLIADEFNGRQSPLYPAWIEGLKRLGQNDAFKGKAFYGYCGGPGMYSRPQSRELVNTVFNIHSYMAWERYLHEMPTEAEAQAFLDSHLGAEMQKWRATFPGCEARLVMVPPLFTLVFGMDVQPQVDFKAWLDMQIHYYATNPAFQGLFGLQYWTSSYADEEYARWAFRLFRHYGIEGNTELLSAKYGYTYGLDHISNPDFAEELKGWTVEAAAEGSVGTRYIERYANLEGRYWLRGGTPDEPAGNTVLWTKRVAAKPNRVSQGIRNLKPGQLYSIKLITSDYGDLLAGQMTEKRLAVSIAVEGGEVVADKSFQATYDSKTSPGTPEPYNAQNPAWFNLHRVVFRAAAETAKVTISDWAAPDNPGGPEGQELAGNFVQVQPYFME